MRTIARLTRLEDAYRGMEILRHHAIPPALAQDGNYFAVKVDDDFVPHAEELFRTHDIETCGSTELSEAIGGNLFFEEDNT